MHGELSCAWGRTSSKIGVVRGKVNLHPVRTHAAWLLLLAQISLLWLAVLHRHQEEAVSARATAVHGGGQWPQPTLETGLICTACQIVRHSAARPALGTPAPNPAASTSLGVTADPSELILRQPSVVYGRAPPLG